MRLALLALCLCACSHTLDGSQNPPLVDVWPVTAGNLARSTFVVNDGAVALAVIADDRGRTLATVTTFCDAAKGWPIRLDGHPDVALTIRATGHRVCLLQAPRELGWGVIWHDHVENPPVYGAELTARHVFTPTLAGVYPDPPPLGAPVYRGDGVLGLVGGATALDVRTLLAEQGLHAQSLHQGELQYDPEEEHREREDDEGDALDVCADCAVP